MMLKKLFFLAVLLIAEVCFAEIPTEDIAKLANASFYNTGQSGPAGVQSPYATPYKTLIQQGTLKEIKELYEKGSQAGKLYALTALQQRDKKELIEMLKATDFSKLQTPVIIQMGGVAVEVSFLEGIRYLLQPEFQKYLPKSTGTDLKK